MAADLHHFTMVLHHNGYFVQLPNKSYVNGNVDRYDYCNVDIMSTLEIDDMLQKFGYSGLMSMNYY